MNNRQHLMAAVAVVALCAAPAVLMGQDRAQDKAVVKLGVVSFMTGALAGPVGSALRNGIELTVDAIRAGSLPAPYAGKGFGGLDAEILLVDENGGATKQATEFTALVQQRGVDAVIGYNSAGTCLAIAPLAERLQVVTVFASCGANMVEEGKSKYVFHTTPNLHADGVTAARYLLKRKPGIKSIAGLNQNFAYGQDSWRDFSLSMAALAPASKAVAEQFPSLGNNQYGTDISRLLSLAPDATHSSLNGTDLESFLTQLTARDLHTKTQLVLPAAEGVIYALGDKVPDGTLIGARGSYGIFAKDTALSRWFRKAYAERYKTTPNYLAYQGAQGVLGLKIAYDKAQKQPGRKPAADLVVAAFEGLHYEAFGTQVKLSRGRGHQAIVDHAMGVYRFDRASGLPTVSDVVSFPAECVNPPEGVNATEWIKSGFPGSHCPN